MAELCNPIDLAALEAEQRRFLDEGRARDVGRRCAALERLEAGLETREDELLQALAADLGKPPLEAWLAELHFVRREIRLVRRSLRRWARPRRVANPFYFFPARSELRHEPFGRVLLLAPWNYPIQLALSPLIGAVAAGNSVVLKPSEQAPASSAALRELVAAAFEPGQAAVVEGAAELGAQLLRERFDFLFFTGGEAVGREVAAAAAARLVPCVLELGGKCPVVVDSGVPLDTTARRIAVGKWFNAGQTCMAPDFVAVRQADKAAIIEQLVATLREFSAGSPGDDLARIVNRHHYDRLLALDSGRVTRVGGDDEGSLRLAPRVIDADWDHPAMRSEVFGPLLPVVGFEDEEQLLERLSGLPDPLALYLFSQDAGFIDRMSSRIRSGSIGVNDVMKQATNVRMPLGGVGRSGHGRYRGRAGFEAFSQLRPVTRRGFWCDPFAVAPPYQGIFERLRRWLR